MKAILRALLVVPADGTFEGLFTKVHPRFLLLSALSVVFTYWSRGLLPALFAGSGIAVLVMVASEALWSDTVFSPPGGSSRTASALAFIAFAGIGIPVSVADSLNSFFGHNVPSGFDLIWKLTWLYIFVPILVTWALLAIRSERLLWKR